MLRCTTFAGLSDDQNWIPLDFVLTILGLRSHRRIQTHPNHEKMNLPKLLDKFQRPDNSQILSFTLILTTSEVYLRVSARMLINFRCLRVPISYQISQEIYRWGPSSVS